MNLSGVESEIRVVFEGAGDGWPAPAEAVLSAVRNHYAALCGTERAGLCADLSCDDGMFLQNGARLYNDHGYVEYATPECSLTSDAVAAVRAGDRIVGLAAKKAGTALPGSPAIAAFRNNRDYAIPEAHSCGAHVNVRMTRRGFERIFTDPKALYGFVVPFFVCLPAICGSGTIADCGEGERFCIWQRAPFLKDLVALRTTFDRPLVNSRDESLDAEPERYARFHIIAFDANVAEMAEFCKLGLLRLLCAAIDANRLDLDLELTDPLSAIRNVARDPFASLNLTAGKTIGPIDLLARYVESFGRMVEEGVFVDRVPDAREIVDRSAEVLGRLARDPLDLVGALDWPTKFVQLERFREEHHLGWSDPILKWKDIQYHSLTARPSPAGALERVTTDRRIGRLVAHAPEGTRGEIRGRIIRQFSEAIAGLDWHLIFSRSDKVAYLLSDDPTSAQRRRPREPRSLRKAAQELGLTRVEILRVQEGAPIVSSTSEIEETKSGKEDSSSVV